MPYITHERRVMLNVIIDGLVDKIRKYEHPQNFISYAALRCVVNGTWSYISKVDMFLGRLHHKYPEVRNTVDGLVQRLREMHATNGDINYTLTRIVLESLKPESGWSYHSLSNAVALMNNVADILINAMDDDNLVDLYRLVSIPRDVATEIERRLLGPYEDTAILKNGDIGCFREPFAKQPNGIRTPQNVFDGGQPKSSMLNNVSAGHAACNEPVILKLHDVAEELESQLLEDLKRQRSELEAEYFRRCLLVYDEEKMNSWKSANDYDIKMKAYNEKIAQLEEGN